MPVATVNGEANNVPRSSVEGLMALLGAVRKAWVIDDDEVLLEPTTWPKSLMPSATVDPPLNRVPTSSVAALMALLGAVRKARSPLDRKSTRLNSSHGYISYA